MPHIGRRRHPLFAVPGLIFAGIFAFTLSWNEFISALALIPSSGKKTLPVAVLTQLVQGDELAFHKDHLIAIAPSATY